jgi:ligand-binding sensor domain-containing protein
VYLDSIGVGGYAAEDMMQRILVAALVVLLNPNAQALDPSRAISQYAHTAWRTGDGDLASAPSAITQTSDGYIWVGTIAGLLRFDGVRFTRWTPPKDGPTLPTATIISLLASRDGSLWIGTATLPMGFPMKDVVLLAVSFYLLKQDVMRLAPDESANDLPEMPTMAHGRP